MNCFSGAPLSAECTESILQTLAEGLVLIDITGTVMYCNRAFETMTGRTRDQIVGSRCCSMLEDMQCDPPPGCDLFSAGEIVNYECTLMQVSGSKLTVVKNARVMYDDSGKPLGAVETFTDISALRSTEEMLRKTSKSENRHPGQGRLVGTSHPMRELYDLIELAAASNATILITGETGTGKELVADAIHAASGRKNGSFVKINCAAIPETLLESELFGHSRGAFTGAVRDKPGRFEYADGGTLFLDEVGELPAIIQVKLLRFLQERQFERIGENHTRQSDVRLIAATNRDLRQLVSAGDFREDLFYRLKVFPISLSPLRDRKEDIGPLVDHFIDKFNLSTGKHITGLTRDAAITLMDYCWPGNVRELENAVEHAFVTCREDKIDLFDLPVEIRRVEMRKGICSTEESPPVAAMQSSPGIMPRKITDDEFLEILAGFDNNQTEVARRLGIDRTTVWRRLRQIRKKSGEPDSI